MTKDERKKLQKTGTSVEMAKTAVSRVVVLFKQFMKRS